MKKIVTAAAIAAMAASFAAAEVTTSLNVRVRPDLYKVTGCTENGNTDAYTKTTYADIDGFGGNKDTLAVKGSTDYAGVAAEITLLNPGNAKGKTGAFEIDNYYGWLNWGALKFTAGKNAAITTALRLNKVLNPKDGGTDYTFDIPVVLRVKM